jgi:hypothetical protein
MSNRARIWASWEGNRGFWPVFAMNKYLSTKPKANPLGLKPILDIFLKPQKLMYNTVLSNQARI